MLHQDTQQNSDQNIHIETERCVRTVMFISLS